MYKTRGGSTLITIMPYLLLVGPRLVHKESFLMKRVDTVSGFKTSMIRNRSYFVFLYGTSTLLKKQMS
jgi:hypothetical protein